MGRPPCCDKVGVKKGPWTPEEDIILVSYIQEHGPGNWRAVPTNTGKNKKTTSLLFLHLESLPFYLVLSISFWSWKVVFDGEVELKGLKLSLFVSSEFCFFFPFFLFFPFC